MDAIVIEKEVLQALLDRIEELEYLFDMRKEEAIADHLYSIEEARSILRISRTTLQT